MRKLAPSREGAKKTRKSWWRIRVGQRSHRPSIFTQALLLSLCVFAFWREVIIRTPRSLSMFRSLLLLALAAPLAAAEKKNVVVLIADDLGMQVGCCGDAVAKTPHLDALAKSGTLFT